MTSRLFKQALATSQLTAPQGLNHDTLQSTSETMGGSSSKVARTGASTIRSFPSTPSAATRTIVPQRPIEAAQRHPPPSASTQKTDAINMDARDPAFAARLHKLGVVSPNPFIPLSQQPHQNESHNLAFQLSTPSSSSSHQYQQPQSHMMNDPFTTHDQNPALLVLRAREALQKQHDSESEQVGSREFEGRSFMDVGSLRRTGVSEQEIEKKFGLRKGVVGRIGPREIVDVVTL